MKAELIHFLSTDNLHLPGLLFESPEKTKKVALFLHGNGSSSIFYSSLTPILGNHLTDAGISYFPFNNRGAHLIKSLKKIENGKEERVEYGTTYELIKDCIKDIDGAIAMLQARGYEEFYLIGESTGANKIVVYNFYQKENPVKKYILLSGGDDTGITYDELGAETFQKALSESKKEIDAGNGLHLVPETFSTFPLSYQSLFDMINPDGDYNVFPFNEYFNNLHLAKKELFKEFKSIEKTTLVIYGENDEYCYGDVPRCIDALMKHTSRGDLFKFTMMRGADHGFSGKEKELSDRIVAWLKTDQNI